jgi:hypothetical protein
MSTHHLTVVEVVLRTPENERHGGPIKLARLDKCLPKKKKRRNATKPLQKLVMEDVKVLDYERRNA